MHKTKKMNLITKDIFYDSLGNNQIERMKNYTTLLIDDNITSSYLKNIWGSNAQRYREQDKINRNRKHKQKV